MSYVQITNKVISLNILFSFLIDHCHFSVGIHTHTHTHTHTRTHTNPPFGDLIPIIIYLLKISKISAARI